MKNQLNLAHGTKIRKNKTDLLRRRSVEAVRRANQIRTVEEQQILIGN